MDATYAGSAGRNLEMYYDLNTVPDGTRFLDQNPAARDPGSTSATAVLAPEFLRPYSGYQSIRVRGNSGTSDYHALQVQVNRRYIHGVQFGGAYTLQRARGLADEDPGNLSITLNRPQDYFFSELAQSNRHSLVINYSWDISAGPVHERGRAPRAGRLAALGRECVRLGRLGAGHPHDQRQLRLHRRGLRQRRRRSAAGSASRGPT